MATWIWLSVAITGVMIGIGAWLYRRAPRDTNSTETNRIIYVVAASICTMVMASILTQVMDLVPGNVTLVDVGALAVISILTGIFLTLSVTTHQAR